MFACVADIGWITGHSYVVYGPLCNGATTVLFESTPIYPDPGIVHILIDFEAQFLKFWIMGNFMGIPSKILKFLVCIFFAKNGKILLAHAYCVWLLIKWVWFVRSLLGDDRETQSDSDIHITYCTEDVIEIRR